MNSVPTRSCHHISCREKVCYRRGYRALEKQQRDLMSVRESYKASLATFECFGRWSIAPTIAVVFTSRLFDTHTLTALSGFFQLCSSPFFSTSLNYLSDSLNNRLTAQIKQYNDYFLQQYTRVPLQVPQGVCVWAYVGCRLRYILTGLWSGQ